MIVECFSEGFFLSVSCLCVQQISILFFFSLFSFIFLGSKLISVSVFQLLRISEVVSMV